MAVGLRPMRPGASTRARGHSVFQTSGFDGPPARCRGVSGSRRSSWPAHTTRPRLPGGEPTTDRSRAGGIPDRGRMPGRHRTGARALGAVNTAAANALTLTSMRGGPQLPDSRRPVVSPRLGPFLLRSESLDRGDRSELPLGVTVLVVGLRCRRARRGRSPRRRRIDLIVGLARTGACSVVARRRVPERRRNATERPLARTVGVKYAARKKGVDRCASSDGRSATRT